MIHEHYDDGIVCGGGVLDEIYCLSLIYMFGLDGVLYCNIVKLLAIMGDIEYMRLPVPVVS